LALGYNTVAGLAFDPESGTLYGNDTFTSTLLSINRLTGAATPMGNYGSYTVQGMAYDTMRDILYATDIGAGYNLLVLDSSNGSVVSATLLNPSLKGIQGLAYDVATDNLFGTHTPVGDQRYESILYLIDPSTGNMTQVGSGIGFPGVFGLAPLAPRCIPEPSTVVIWVLGLLGAVLCARRRRFRI